MNKPYNSSRISELERQVSNKNRRISELENSQNQLISKQNIIESVGEISQSKLGFALSATRRAEIVDASNSQEAWKIRDQAIKERFGEMKQARKNAFYLNIALGTLAGLSLLGVGYLIIWREKDQVPSQPSREKKKIKAKKN